MELNTHHEIGDTVFALKDCKAVSFVVIGIGISAYKDKEPQVTLYGKEVYENEKLCFTSKQALIDYVSTPE